MEPEEVVWVHTRVFMVWMVVLPDIPEFLGVQQWELEP